MQDNVSFHNYRIFIFQLIICVIFFILAANMDSGSNEYLQAMFFRNNNNTCSYPIDPTFPHIKCGFPGRSLHRLVGVI